MTTGAVVGQVDLGDHICWTHDDETSGLDAVAWFVPTGLPRDQNVRCLLGAPGPGRVLAAVRERGAGMAS
ncbi:hypothetical protein ACN26Y_22265 [Micromonospora sp. WMMD558]|uniref:hypothetical protein n=1 Tax=unclassified Micromonospora TaxID=2617518 RepID=UPI0012B4E1EF|nr:hypothetical protein [Micromonospora sp. WMMC415]QGN48752.1 hypothetical protein GKC29_19280 [Micromonospora sp. WMMC415]